MTEVTHDVAIIGAGAAGATAATCLARRERRVLLLDRATFPRPAGDLGWLNALALPIVKQLRLANGALLAQPVNEVSFHAADFSKTSTPHFASPPAYLINRGTLNNEMVQAAVRAGTTLLEAALVRQIRLLEHSVKLQLADGRSYLARLLLLASGNDAELPQAAGFLRTAGAGLVTGQVEAAAPAGSGGSGPRLLLILGLDREGSFGLCLLQPERTAVVINWAGEPERARPEFIALCRRLYQRRLVPVDVATGAAQVPLTASPAGLALDLDSHVGKHTLLVGQAGGFVAAGSNEGIYPAMWSAQLAAEVIHRALDSEQSQDTLMTFEQRWRTTMADYLRPPNTDIQFLLPLIFSNQAMADRMGAAFFAGENI
ncbi:MAG TPA: FAD-dependent oxidoreductase [Phycisphaerae bacterium]|nr:FAD-dependent oxidoreductase [Phycisphaerae bacterium]HNU44048.1 FAD-dependent oxidoreductase [Phycisphaerae bacterium]